MKKQGTKIVVVGAGQVGATTAYTLLLSGLASELVLIDLNEKKTRGEVLELARRCFDFSRLSCVALGEGRAPEEYARLRG